MNTYCREYRCEGYSHIGIKFLTNKFQGCFLYKVNLLHKQSPYLLLTLEWLGSQNNNQRRVRLGAHKGNKGIIKMIQVCSFFNKPELGKTSTIN